MSVAGGTLIKLKDDIHSKWFLLQQSKRGNAEAAFLDKGLYDKIVELGHQAVADLEKTQPDSIYIERIQNALHEVELKSWVADEARMGTKVWYSMDPEKATTAITLDINRLANEVHRAGMTLVKTAERYCGCKLQEGLEDLRSINTGVLRYCQGALRLGSPRGIVFEPGDVVEHRPGAAESHANQVRFEPTEKGYIVEMEYSESGDANWRMRQDGVVNFVESKGGECQTADLSAKCRIEEASEDDIFELALFISQLKDIDLLSSDCISIAFEEAMNQIKELKTVEPVTKVWDTPWMRASNQPRVAECEGEEEDEDDLRRDRRRREELKRRRLEDEMDNYASDIQHQIVQSGKDMCYYRPYQRLDEAHVYLDSLEGICNRLYEETESSADWCKTLKYEKEELLEEACKDLTKRCPAEPIILGLEPLVYIGHSGNYVLPYELHQIRLVCDIAGDAGCLDVLRQVEERAQAGTKVKELPLEWA